MARSQSYFRIGLFVAAGIVIGVAAVIWLGASQYFEKGVMFATYFDESVQGLQVDSRVKYRGVDIGKVESIGVAPDRKLVEVVMKIDLAGETGENVVTQLRAAGITGIVFIELDRRNEGDAILVPPPGMQTRYPVIPSQLSQSKQMLSSVDRIMTKIEQVDLKGISDHIKETVHVAEDFLAGRQMTGILAKIEAMTGTLDQVLKRIDRILAEGKVEGILDQTGQALEEARLGMQESRKTIAEVRELVTGIRGKVEEFRASETLDQAGQLIKGIDRRTRGIKMDVEKTTEDIREAVDSLKLLLDRLQANPSDLIFSRPPVQAAP